MQIDAVQQWPGDFLAVIFDLPDGATAFALHIAVIAAWSGVHGSHQHEASQRRD
jgi:hypothetical protein